MPIRDAIYEYGDWQIDLARRELRSRGVPVPIGGRAFEIVEVLVREAGELVTKDDLMDRVWPGATVEENTLQVHVSAVRKAFGADRSLVTTASGRGYRLLGTWTRRRADAPVEAAAQEASMPCQSFTSNFAGAVTDLIGRAAAVEELQTLVSAYRVVTLTGPGGIGKTRLALETGRRLFPTFGGSGWLIELSSVAKPELVPSAVAGVLGLKLSGEVTGETVASAIAGQKLLLILDNCEHVVDAAAAFVETVTRLSPQTVVLVTSREVLRIDGEYVYRVPPLSVPPENSEGPDAILGHSAVQLFVARTRMADSDFAQHGDHLPVLATICRRLDGIPLAIEFAAARAATLGLRDVASRLDNRFDLLTGGRRTALPRHQTLRATLDWSYELLPEAEQRLLRHVAVFSGGFTLDAAMAVTGLAASDAAATVEGISNLVAKSLVQRDASVSVSRWRLLETTRAYVFEKLKQTEEINAACRRHAEYFRDLLAPATLGSHLRPAEDGMAGYVREIDNVRVALDWSFSPAGDATTGIVLTAAYVPVWLHLSLLVECRQHAERALAVLRSDATLSPHLKMQVQVALGMAEVGTAADWAWADADTLREALDLAERLGDRDARLRAVWRLWSHEYYSGDWHEGLRYAELFMKVAAHGDPADILVGHRLLATTQHYRGEQREARRHIEHMLASYVAPPDQRHIFWFQHDQRIVGRTMLALILSVQGFTDQAWRQIEVNLEEAQSKDLTLRYVLGWGMFPIALMRHDLGAAARALQMYDDIASVHLPFWKLIGEGLQGALLIKQGEPAAGVPLLSDVVGVLARKGWIMCFPGLVGILAEGHASLGRIPEALRIVDDAVARSERGGGRWYEPELLRTKGEFLLLAGGDDAPAADCFGQALALARQQDARVWELRAALSLARLRLRQDRGAEARAVLAPVYGGFTEGFATPDLRAAQEMLTALPD